MKRSILIFWSLMTAGLCATAAAQTVTSDGESSQVHACFYECKPGPTVRGTPTWQATTTLLVGRLDPVSQISSTYQIFYMDGDANFLARSFSSGLQSFDLDEIHVCRTLQAASIPPPKAGLAIMSTGSRSHYWWAKNLLGKFFVDRDEPFDGKVSGIAKFGCRVVPDGVLGQFELSDRYFESGAPTIPPILIEDTEQ